MAAVWKWLYVPVAFTLLRFAVPIVLWSPGLARDAASTLFFPDTATLRSLLSNSLLHGVGALLVTLLAMKLLPPINLKQVLCVAICAVMAEALTQFMFIAIHGPTATNGAQLLQTAGSYVLALLVSNMLLRRRRNAGAAA
jgi:hypothetical protein